MDQPKRLKSLFKKSKFAPKSSVKTEASRSNGPSKPSDVKCDAAKKSENSDNKKLSDANKPSTFYSRLDSSSEKSNTNKPTDKMKRCECDADSIENEDGTTVCSMCGVQQEVQQIMNTVAFEQSDDGGSRLLGKIVGGDG